MSGGRALRTELLVASVLWTLGVLVVASVLLIAFLAHHPRPHVVILRTFAAVPSVVTLAAGLSTMTWGALRMRRTLAAMDQLRVRLGNLHRDNRAVLEGDYPAEVQPLVDELNALLAERERRVRQAVAKAGDLAHGLKTPLAVLAIDAERASLLNDGALARSLSAQVAHMRRHIEYHLAHARATGASLIPAHTKVAASVDALVRTMLRVHAGKAPNIAVEIPTELAVACGRDDFEEIVGNLLDNACKWCHQHVRIEARESSVLVEIVVEDDGPGLLSSQAATVLQRGARADERLPGWGLGLAIAHDLLAVYGGTLGLQRASLGGLSARIRLPGA